MLKKPLPRIVLLLSLLTIAGIAALAVAGRPNGIVTSNDGRFAIATKAPSAVTPALPEPALTKIAGNLSSYQYGVYFCCYGLTISGPNSFLNATYWAAVPFTPTANYNVTRVAASVAWGQSGTNGVTLSLNADANGLPGPVLANGKAIGNITNLGFFGNCCQLAIGNSSTGVSVSSGTQYWLVVSTSTSTETTFDAWAFNSTDMRSFPYAFYNNGTWNSTQGLQPGYAIYGTQQ